MFEYLVTVTRIREDMITIRVKANSATEAKRGVYLTEREGLLTDVFTNEVKSREEYMVFNSVEEADPIEIEFMEAD